MDNSLGGFEFLSCIPGTVGGGIKMNAGCFGREFKDILISIQAINKKGQVILNNLSYKAPLVGSRSNHFWKDLKRLAFISAELPEGM